MKIYNCNSCKYTTANNSNFHKNVRTHSDNPKSHYRYNCLACNERVKDLYNLACHCRSDHHIKNVRDKFPQTLKNKTVCGVPFACQGLDLSKRHMYIKDRKGESLSTLHVNVKPADRIMKKEKIVINKFFKDEYFELEREEKQDKVEYLMKVLDSSLLTNEFPNINDHIEDGDFDSAYCEFYNFFKQDGIKQYLIDMGENVEYLEF